MAPACLPFHDRVAQRRRMLLRVAAAGIATAIVGSRSLAQDRSATIRIVVPFPAGNPVEAGARALVQALNLTSGRNYIIENRPGAGGTIGTTEVARAKPDGSVLLYVTGGHTSALALYGKLPYHPIDDFAAVSQVVTAAGFGLIVRQGSPYRTVQELLQAAQSKPNSISYASLGNGNTTHLIGALFAQAAKAEFVHVPYRNSPMPDLLGGHVEFTWVGTTLARPLVLARQVRMLVTSSRQRLAEFPDVPTFADLGLKDVDVPAWTGILGPRGMPAESVVQVFKEIAAAVKHPDYQAYVKTTGNDVVTTQPQQFAAYLRSEVERYGRVLPPLGIKME